MWCFCNWKISLLYPLAPLWLFPPPSRGMLSAASLENPWKQINFHSNLHFPPPFLAAYTTKNLPLLTETVVCWTSEATLMNKRGGLFSWRRHSDIKLWIWQIAALQHLNGVPEKWWPSSLRSHLPHTTCLPSNGREKWDTTDAEASAEVQHLLLRKWKLAV